MRILFSELYFYNSQCFPFSLFFSILYVFSQTPYDFPPFLSPCFGKNNKENIPIQETPELKSRSDIIEYLQSELSIIDVIIDDLAKFVNTVKNDSQIDLTNEGDQPQTLISRKSILEHINKRLNFIVYLMRNSKLILSLEYIDNIWESLIVSGIPALRDAGFAWIGNICESAKIDVVFEEGVEIEFFRKRMLNIDIVPTMSTSGKMIFECI